MNNQKQKVFIGFDSSNYTSSMAICDFEGRVILNEKLLLPVKDGERGLRQSDAVFHHVSNYGELLKKHHNLFSNYEIVAVGSSERPRDVLKSYMPCFLVGRDIALSVSMASNVPYYDFSHQAGHIMAAIYSSDSLEMRNKEFIAFHVSGGTTDILYVKPNDKHMFEVDRIGGTLDLNAGQIIDRAGVMMDFKFPCGKEIERHALEYKGKIPNSKISVNGFDFNLSGVENIIQKLYQETNDKNLVSSFVINSILKTLETVTLNILEKYKLPVVYAGGVMSCSIIKESLSKYGKFALPEFSSDNAAGISLMTRIIHLGK